jgi:cytochrome c-type biogenesis protein
MTETLANGLEGYLQQSVVLALAAAFAGGVLASFTPCVYPMIPITASYVGSRNIGGSRSRAFALSIAYVVGISLTYAALGMIAALTGRFFGEIATNPWAYFIVANVIIVLGLGMFDVFTIPMFAVTGTPKPGGLAAVFVLGIVSGFVAGPCTAPVMGVLLAYVATTQSVLLGGLLLFIFSLGMSVLLVLVGTFSGAMAALPRSGEWMVKIKKIIGVIMIGLGEYFLIKAGQLMI